MQKYFCLLLWFFSVNGSAQEDQFYFYNNRYFVNQNKMYLGDSVLYNGEYVEYYPGKVKNTGKYCDGLKDGVFRSFDSDGNMVSEITYQDGERNGSAKTYNEWGYLLSDEWFDHDSLVSGIYWHRSGQLEKTFLNGKIQLYPVDSTVYRIMPMVKGMVYNYSKDRYELKKKEFCRSDDPVIQIVAIRCGNCFGEDMSITDTIVLCNYKILSFLICSPVYDDSTYSQHTDYITGTFYENRLSPTFKNDFCQLYPAKISFENIQALDGFNIVCPFNFFYMIVKER